MSDEHAGDRVEDPEPPDEPTIEIGADEPLADETVPEELAETGEPMPEQKAPTLLSARTEIPFGLIVFLIIAVLLVIFTVQNSSEDVTLKFLPWEGQYPLALIIIGVVAVTVILDEVFGLFLRQRRRRRLAEKQELQRLREQNR